MPDSPASQTPTSEPVTPAVDPSPTVTPTASPSLFAEISKISTKILHRKSRCRLKLSIRDKLSSTTAGEFSLI